MRKHGADISRVGSVILGVFFSCIAIESNFMKKNGSEPSRDSTVITPGGPKPSSKVHTIKPGERLQVDPDGVYRIVPDPDKPDKQDKKD
jgi:hypothetical protein